MLVLMESSGAPIDEGSPGDLGLILPRLERDFPEDERMPAERVVALVRDGTYRLLLARGGPGGEIVGYALLFEPEQTPVVWIDYLAVDPGQRGRGHGSRLFERASRHRPGALCALFEVEPADGPGAAARREQERRIAFYRRLGARPVTDAYAFPRTGRRMGLWCRPSPGVASVSGEVVRAAVAAAWSALHGDVPGMEQLLGAVLSEIEDLRWAVT